MHPTKSIPGACTAAATTWKAPAPCPASTNEAHCWCIRNSLLVANKEYPPDSVAGHIQPVALKRFHVGTATGSLRQPSRVENSWTKGQKLKQWFWWNSHSTSPISPITKAIQTSTWADLPSHPKLLPGCGWMEAAAGHSAGIQGHGVRRTPQRCHVRHVLVTRTLDVGTRCLSNESLLDDCGILQCSLS